MSIRFLSRPWRAVFLCALLIAAGRLEATAASVGVTSVATGNPRLEAARLMTRALASIKALRQDLRLPIDPSLDPNGTGIVGDEFTSLTTSLGDVEAKRSSADPAFAAAIVRYFQEAGLRPGDVVAIGGSGSFPALLLATLCACRALDLQPIVVYSIGASMYGANLPGFTFVQMLDRLRGDGLLPYRIAAVSPGGNGDRGGGTLFDEEGHALEDETARTGLPQVGGATLAERITGRMNIFTDEAAGRRIRCFVNVGGAAASFGATPDSLRFPNGLVRRMPVPATGPTRGLIFEFASRGIPVVHLLHVKGLARDNHIPFDSVPFPPVGEGDVYTRR
jgi:poly-gamma-glutamate system protein